jgi:hypothetical protein
MRTHAKSCDGGQGIVRQERRRRYACDPADPDAGPGSGPHDTDPDATGSDPNDTDPDATDPDATGSDPNDTNAGPDVESEPADRRQLESGAQRFGLGHRNGDE